MTTTPVLPSEVMAALEVIRRATVGGVQMVSAAPTGPTVRRIWEAYKLAKSAALRSWPTQESLWKSLGPLFGERNAAGLTLEDVDLYRDARRQTVSRLGRAPRPATLNHEVGLLSRMLTFAVERGMLAANPIERVKKDRVHNLRMTSLTDAQIDRLIGECRNPLLKAYVVVLADTGARRMEILTLRWNQVDLDRGVLTLVKTKNGHPRKPLLTSRAVAALRSLPRVSDDVFATECRHEYRGLRGPRRTTRGRLPKVRRYHAVYLYRLFREACDRAGLVGVDGESVLFHTLRHAFVQRARRLRIPERVIMEWGGWRNRATMDRYGSLVGADEMEAARAALDAGAGRGIEPGART